MSIESKKEERYDERRRVNVVYEDFVVIVELTSNGKSILKGDFVTCYIADKSIDKIKRFPRWEKNKFLKYMDNSK